MRALITGLFICISFSVFSQYGGSYTYAYLNLPPSARIAALGGLNISTYDHDVNFAFQNPALLNKQMDGRLSVSHAIMNAGINHGYAVYAKYIKKWNIMADAGILYNAYGLFKQTDEAGNVIGSYKAGEFALHTGAAYHENKLSYGAHINLLYSQLESYSSVGASIDLGGVYRDSAKQFTVAITMRNIGTEFKAYTSGNYEALPFQINAGITKRLAHLPLQFSITLHDLQTFDVRYDDPNVIQQVNIFTQDSTTEDKKYTADKLLRHVIVGGEFYFGSHVNVRIGYDHMARRELALETRRGLTGFSLGAGIKINKYAIDYAHQFYTLAGGSNTITISTNLTELFHQ